MAPEQPSSCTSPFRLFGHHPTRESPFQQAMRTASLHIPEPNTKRESILAPDVATRVLDELVLMRSPSSSKSKDSSQSGISITMLPADLDDVGNERLPSVISTHESPNLSLSFRPRESPSRIHLPNDGRRYFQFDSGDESLRSIPLTCMVECFLTNAINAFRLGERRPEALIQTGTLRLWLH